MAREFKNLSKELRSYINNRFGKYDISGEDAFYHYLVCLKREGLI